MKRLLLAALLAAAGTATAAPPARPAPAAGTAAPATSAPAPLRKGVPVDVEAATIEYRYKERRSVMTGDPLVRLTREDAVLVCRKLSAEMDAAGQIARAWCEGDVKLTRGERVVTCERAVFENAAGQVTCEGNPVLNDGPSRMRGEKLTYFLDEDRVTLSRATGTVIQQPGQTLPGARRAER